MVDERKMEWPVLTEDGHSTGRVRLQKLRPPKQEKRKRERVVRPDAAQEIASGSMLDSIVFALIGPDRNIHGSIMLSLERDCDSIANLPMSSSFTACVGVSRVSAGT
jgi:hypothetical protein